MGHGAVGFSNRLLRLVVLLKILLHVCCGPCSTVPIEEFTSEGHELAIFYSNSNIHPKAEYVLRRDTAAKYAGEKGIPFYEGDYDPNNWIEAVGDCRKYGVERCSRCYRMRFAETADFAVEWGADAIASSLTISPYQFTNAINRELKEAAQKVGIEAIESDYRPRYHDSVVLSRAAGMYRQNFCGCMYSQVEAQEQRDAAKAKRLVERARRRVARGEKAAREAMATAPELIARMEAADAREAAAADGNSFGEARGTMAGMED